MKSSGMSASGLSKVLIGVCIFLLAGLTAGCVLIGTMLKSQATDATHAVIDADVSDGETQRLEELQAYLTKNADLVSQTAQLAGSIGQYQQNTIVATVNEYARQAGVSITGFTFASSSTLPSAAGAKDGIDITLGTPLPYRNFIVFLDLLEKGLMPVQVLNANIVPDPQNASNVIINGLKIKVAN